MMQNQSDSSGDNAPLLIFKHLYPAVLQSFAIILLGYSASRWNFIPSSQCQGLAKYIGHFALPALLFQEMTTLSFGAVDCLFWTSFLVAKGVVFVLVFVVTLVVGMPRSHGTAAIFAMFATQSNDFALGYPITTAVYKSTHPELLQYIYLLGPISLICLNPFGFLSLEVEGNRNRPYVSKLRTALRVGRGVITNPLVVSALLGIVVNILAHQKMPSLVEPAVTVLSDSFSACALFYLGVSLSGKLQKVAGRSWLPMVHFVMPLMVVLSVGIFQPGSGSNMTDVYANYAFLYGTIPTTPSVFIYATQYAVSQDVIASSMFLCTFLSAPLLFLSGTTAMIPHLTQDASEAILDRASFIISCLGLVSSMLLLGLFVKKKVIKTIPHQFTSNLVISQILIAVGAIVGVLVQDPVILGTCFDSLLVVGMLASRFWALCIAMAMCIIKMKRTYAFGLPWFTFGFYLLGYGCPVVLTIMCFLLTGSPWKPDEALEELERQQALVSIVLNSLILTGTVGVLLGLSKVDSLQSGTADDSSRSQRDPTVIGQGDFHFKSVNVDPASGEDPPRAAFFEERESPLLSCTSSSPHLVSRDEGKEVNDGHLQLEQHLTLVILSAASVLLSLVSNVFKMSQVDPYPCVFLVICLLDCTLIRGQGFFAFLIFAFRSPKMATCLKRCNPGRIWHVRMKRSAHLESSC